MAEQAIFYGWLGKIGTAILQRNIFELWGSLKLSSPLNGLPEWPTRECIVICVILKVEDDVRKWTNERRKNVRLTSSSCSLVDFR